MFRIATRAAYKINVCIYIYGVCAVFTHGHSDAWAPKSDFGHVARIVLVLGRIFELDTHMENGDYETMACLSCSII